MSALLIVVLVVLAVLALLAIVGAASQSRRNAAGAASFAESLATVDRQLAAALAEDRGWTREALEAAARSEFATHRPGAEIAGLELTQVVDRPGTDEDLAVFRVRTPSGSARVTLARRDGAWYAASVEDDR